MRKYKNMSFEDLVTENKKELLNDPKALMKLEKKLEDRQAKVLGVSR